MQISDRADADNLVESQINAITQTDLVTLIRSLRVPARCENRPWDYGKPGETYPCWIVLEHQASNTAVAYCAEGFGPTYPWGLLFIRDHLSMGSGVIAGMCLLGLTHAKITGICPVAQA
jgi:hypothetical protein